MLTKCKFDKNKDIQEYVPDLAVSIQEAVITGVIKDTATSMPYTKETEVEKVGHYLHDAIDIAIAAQKLGQEISATTPVANQEKK